MSEIANKLLILIAHKDGILSQIYHLQHNLNDKSTRPKFFDTDNMEKIVSKHIKKFPLPIPDKIIQSPQFDGLRKNGTKYRRKLENLYWVLKNVSEFHDQAIKTLNDLTNVTFSWAINPTLCHHFMDLYTGLIQILLLIDSFEKCKLYLLMYNTAYLFSKGRKLSGYDKVAKFLDNYKKCIIKLEESLNQYHKTVESIIEPLAMTIFQLQDIKQMRSQGIFSLSVNPQKLTIPIEDQLHFLAPHFNKFVLWTVFGILFCPQTLQNITLLKLLTFVLSNLWVVPIYRDVVFYPHQHYESLIKLSKYKKLKIKTHKKKINQTVQASLQKAPKFHKSMRIFLKQEINSLTNLLKNAPGLIPLKINIIYSLLGLCRYEVMWYFHHLSSPPKKGKLAQDDFNNENVAALIYLSDILCSLVSKYEKVIKRYYIKYVSDIDSEVLFDLFQKHLENRKDISRGIKVGIGSLINQISDLDIKTLETGDYDFNIFRVEWLRCESLLSNKTLTKSNQLLSQFGEFAKEMALLIEHTRNIDSVTDSLDMYGGLHTLYPYIEEVLFVFKEAIKGTNGEQKYSISYLHLLKNFYKIIHPTNYEELEDLGDDSSSMAEEFLRIIALRVAGLVRSIAGGKGFLNLENQTKAINIPREIHMKNQLELKGQKYVSKKPGSESSFKNEKSFSHIRNWEVQLSLLCELMNTYKQVTIYDTLFIPTQFVKEFLESVIKKHIMKLLYVEIDPQKAKKKKYHVDVKRPERPSLFLKGLNSLIYATKLVENSLKIDTEEIIRQALLSQIFEGNEGAKGQLIDYEKKTKYSNSMVIAYINWFKSFIKNYLPISIYSTTQRAFLSIKQMPYKAELYFSNIEMESLCSLIGPYGVRMLDNTLIDSLLNDLISIKEILVKNTPELIRMSKNYHEMETTWELLKKMVMLDQLNQLTTKIGAILQLRKMLHISLGKSIKDNAPLIYDNIKVTFELYPNSPNNPKEFVDMDCFAQSIGITQKTSVDHPFKLGILKLQKLKKLRASWELLPFLFASSFYSFDWLKGKYNPDYDAHLNNYHLMNIALQKLFTIPIILKSEESEEDEINQEKMLKDSLKKYIEISSFVLLLLSQRSDLKKPLPLNSMFVFLENFVDKCTWLSLDVIEQYLPYNLLREMYAKQFRDSINKKKKKTKIDLQQEHENEIEKEQGEINKNNDENEDDENEDEDEEED
ncbi:nck-associated protein [Anaeramoeba flamelloides]|uniref:Nck-associated protein n=1 Tax=Anaeramoeba flamelloides TaxID=1746091 RepID=A0AAV7Y6K1_9EUKA|nr:nck-associated protein [Anaeramoeba flamelloides]